MNCVKENNIAIETIRVLKKRFDVLPNLNTKLRNAPFHTAFLKAFYGYLNVKSDEDVFNFLTLSQWFHGLSTTLGQSYFEKVAHILSDGEKRTFENYKICVDKRELISEIINTLKSGESNITGKYLRKRITKYCENNTYYVPGLNFTADVYIEDSKEVTMIELKSVKPNAGEMRGEKEKILYGLSYLSNVKRGKNVYFYLGFPFDPTEDRNNPCGYDKERFSHSLIEFRKYFSEDEFLIAGELWDRLSGEKSTMCKLLKMINDIATPQFLMDLNIILQFGFINEDRLYSPMAIDDEKFEQYISVLKKWHLCAETKLAYLIKDVATGELNVHGKNKRAFERLLHQRMFSSNQMNYNLRRINIIAEIVNKEIG